MGVLNEWFFISFFFDDPNDFDLGFLFSLSVVVSRRAQKFNRESRKRETRESRKRETRERGTSVKRPSIL